MASFKQSPTENKSVKTDVSSEGSSEKTKSKTFIQTISPSSTFSSAKEFVQNNPSAQRVSQPLRRYIFPWWWEAAAGSCSLIFLITIFSILVVVKDKSIGSWHFSLEPNAVVSVLTTLSKAGILVAITGCIGQLKWVHLKESRKLINMESFDEATRGPIGSFLFLFDLKGRPFLASIGAILTILAILFEPFSQQVISFRSRLAVSQAATNRSTGLAVTQIYDTGVRQDYATITQSLDREIIGSSIGSLYGISMPPPYTCDAVKCIWNDVTTLNICESCANSVLGTTRSCEDLTPLPTKPGKSPEIASQMCNFTPPAFPENVMSLTFRGHSDGTSFRQMVNFTFLYQEDVDLGDIEPRPDYWIGNFARIKTPTYNTTPIPMPETAECELNWCAKHYDTVSITNGLYSATPPTTLAFSNQSTRWNSSDNELNYVTLQVDSTLHPEFKGNGTFTLNTLSKYFVGYAFNDLLDSLFEEGGAWVIANSNNIGNDIRIMAEGVSNALRNTTRNNVLSGQVWNYETYIHVEWPWMILPMLLVLIGIVLLVVAIIVSEKSDAPVWKNSTLALVFHGGGEQLRSVNQLDAKKIEQRGVMKRVAKELQVALNASQEGQRKLTIARHSAC